jgi:histidinol-phosphate aminotransferase
MMKLTTRMADVSLYAPNRAPCAVDLSDNTNQWGAAPSAMRALKDASVALATRYPPVYADELKRALAAYLDVDVSTIVTGCGSDDVLDATMRAFGMPGSAVSYAEPTFPMIPTFARMNGLEPAPVRLKAAWELDAQALLSRRAALTYICSPNNPTGRAFGPDVISGVVSEASGVIVIDEAYAEFADWSAVPLLAANERLVVVRTMSKAWGLAGLRIGYGACSTPDLAREIEKARGPYKVNAAANAAALAALQDDAGWMRDRVRDARESRACLARRLAAMGLEAVPSDANFVFVPMSGGVAVEKAMRERGVAIRAFREGIRITVGPWPLMESCLEALAACV